MLNEGRDSELNDHLLYFWALQIL